MSAKQRVKALEKKTRPQQAPRMYVVYDNKNHVLGPGGYMSKAEFEALTLDNHDIVFDVVHVDNWREVQLGIDLEKI